MLAHLLAGEPVPTPDRVRDRLSPEDAQPGNIALIGLQRLLPAATAG
jgi:hypothetical protein